MSASAVPPLAGGPPPLSYRQAAARLGISRQAVYRAVAEGRLASVLVMRPERAIPEEALAGYQPDPTRQAAGRVPKGRQEGKVGRRAVLAPGRYPPTRKGARRAGRPRGAPTGGRRRGHP